MASPVELIDIPQIQHRITLHLNQQGLATAIRLNKTWKDALLPRLYHSVHWRAARSGGLSGRRRQDSPLPVSVEALKAHGHLVRRIVVERFCDLACLIDLCPSVQDLVLPNEAYHWPTLEQFAQGHPCITSLTMLIAKREESVGPERLFRALPNLKKLTVTCRYILSPDGLLYALLQHCRQLESLDMDLFYLGSGGADSHDGNHSECRTRLSPNLALKELTVTFCRDSPSQAMDCVLDVLLRSPRLLSAKLPRFALSRSDYLCRVFQEQCPSIVSLDLSALSKYYEDDSLATVLAAFRCNQLKMILLHSCNFGTKTLGVILERFVDSIEMLRLEYARGTLPSEWIQRVLSECRQLRYISTENHASGQGLLSSADLLRSPWVCHQLEVLRVPIVNVCATSDCTHQPNRQGGNHVMSRSSCSSVQVYGQLAKMKRLREICTASQDTARSVDANEGTLDWSLDGGLDRLAPLVQIEVLQMSMFSQRVTQAEMEWMRAHWPNLRVLAGVGQSAITWAQVHWPELDAFSL